MSAMNAQYPHTHVTRGNAGMETPKKEHKIGNTTIIIHSPLVLMSSEERKHWFENECEKSNPILRQIAEAVEDCYRE